MQLGLNQVKNAVDRLGNLVPGGLVRHLHQILLRLDHLVVLTELSGEDNDIFVRVEAVF